MEGEIWVMMNIREQCIWKVSFAFGATRSVDVVSVEVRNFGSLIDLSRDWQTFLFISTCVIETPSSRTIYEERCNQV